MYMLFWLLFHVLKSKQYAQTFMYVPFKKKHAITLLVIVISTNQYPCEYSVLWTWLIKLKHWLTILILTRKTAANFICLKQCMYQYILNLYLKRYLKSLKYYCYSCFKLPLIQLPKLEDLLSPISFILNVSIRDSPMKWRQSSV